MKNQMRIIQITPGNIPIPPNGWGAVEKVIWEYKLSLDKLGWETQILYCDDVEDLPDQIVHVHMANLADILHERGIPYVFSLHDHHVEYYGRESDVYLNNYRAIKNSRLTFVHSPHLVPYFDNLENIVYLPHGVNLTDYEFTSRTNQVLDKKIKTLMMANNGIGGDALSDRKGFLKGIEISKRLGLGLSILCPSGNRQFFEHHRVNYDKLDIFYDLDYKQSIDKMRDHQIFLHPSNLEAGHPNLTILESISMGIPVVGTCNVSLPGMVNSSLDIDELTDSLLNCIRSYDSLVCDISKNRSELSWDLVVSKMIENYKKYFKISQKKQLEISYLGAKKLDLPKRETDGIIFDFSQGSAFCKVSFCDDYFIQFSDRRTGNIIYHTTTNKSSSMWARADNQSKFVEWEVKVKIGAKIISTSTLDLIGKSVLFKNNNFKVNPQMIEDFIKSSRCVLTIKGNFDYYLEGVFYDERAKEDCFYFSFDEMMLLDYFQDVQKNEFGTLIRVNTFALGDRIAAVPYCNEWAKNMGKKTDVMVSGHTMFSDDDYPYLNFIPTDFQGNWSDIIVLDYKFDRPIQRGFSDQLELPYQEIRPKVKSGEKNRPIKSKYVCLGVHTTSQCKYWNYPDGWEILSKKFRKIGITPVSVDLHQVFGVEHWWNSLPGSSLQKVNLEFPEVINLLTNCEFFVGVSSGLSWLSHALGKKVVLISGTTPPSNEFTQDVVRINNPSVCNSCFTKTNDYAFSPGDWTWCPEHQHTPRWFECTKTITPEFVWQEIEKNNLI